MRNFKGNNEKYLDEIKRIKLSLENSEMRKQEARDSLVNRQRERFLEMKKNHLKAEKNLEEEIEKARSTFKEDDTDGKGEQGQGSGLTARKVNRNRNQAKYKTAKKVSEKSDSLRKTRTTSYSGKELEGKNKQRLKSNHNDMTKANAKSSKNRGNIKPEHDFTPPRGPSLGR